MNELPGQSGTGGHAAHALGDQIDHADDGLRGRFSGIRDGIHARISHERERLPNRCRRVCHSRG